jgi:hypothetical protein
MDALKKEWHVSDVFWKALRSSRVSATAYSTIE